MRDRSEAFPRSEELAEFRDSRHIVITCGVNGCKVTRSGPFGRARLAMDAHREKKHPDWVKPVYRMRGRKRVRIN